MKNPREIQNWHHVSAMLGNVIKRLNVRVGEFDPARIEEYRNAITAVIYRQPLPIIYCGHNAIKHEYELFGPNSVLEAYVHYIGDKFEMHDDTLSGLYSGFDLSQRRRLNEVEITVAAFSYTDGEALSQVKDINSKLKS